MIRTDPSVRQLAEFVCRRGDLYAKSEGRQVEPEEGIACQRQVQDARRAKDPSYECEVSLKAVFDCGDIQRQLSGRADGVCQLEGTTVVEEFKCCGALPKHPDPVDWGQAWFYAGMYAQEHDDVQQLEIRLIYVEADTLQEHVFGETVTRAAAQAGLAWALLCYVIRIEEHVRRSCARLSWTDQLAFPMPDYRPSQRSIARRVYQALSGGENLLLEAPTGSGKTLGVLYPAVKAQAQDDQLFFLTSRNAGAKAALAAAQQLDPAHETLSLVEITAKEKTCFVPGMPCDPERCPYAQGYFDRATTAVQALLNVKHADRGGIEAVAEAHQVCPFELALDTALWADLVIGDYNYVLDPVVRLLRFAGHKQLHLLIDEAHQLSPRVRDMLTVEIDRSVVQQAKKVSHAQLKKCAASVDRALMKLRKEVGEGEHTAASTDSLTRACERLVAKVAEEEIELEPYPDWTPLFFAAHRWLRSSAWWSKDEFADLVYVERRHVRVMRTCLDAGPYMQSIFKEHGSVVRFSGTVSPLPLYQRLHGQADDYSERAQSPFDDEQALVLLVPDIPTYFKQRAASLQQLVSLITRLSQTKPGRYLVALPSYAYLNAVKDALPASTAVYAQSPAQSLEETTALLDAFNAEDEALLCIVMGGIYGESVDFSDARLSGVILVGLGLPPPSLARNLMEAHFDQHVGAGWGRMVAYTQPALVKNIQAAGRLIRSEEDFGVICLIDPRFTSAEVQRFFPSHWRPHVTRAADVEQTVTQFWQNKLAL